MPRALWGSSRGGRFLMSEVLLHSQMTPDELTNLLVAEILVGMATDTTGYLRWRWERVKSNLLTFFIPALPIHDVARALSAACSLISRAHLLADDPGRADKPLVADGALPHTSLTKAHLTASQAFPETLSLCLSQTPIELMSLPDDSRRADDIPPDRDLLADDPRRADKPLVADGALPQRPSGDARYMGALEKEDACWHAT